MSDKYLEGKIKQSIDSFVKERNEALWSLDEKKIKEFFKRYNVEVPDHPAIFWGGVCKAICHITDTPDDVKESARKILKFYGLSEEIK